MGKFPKKNNDCIQRKNLTHLMGSAPEDVKGNAELQFELLKIIAKKLNSITPDGEKR